MDASIRRNFEKLLGQHQVLMVHAIARAHDDAQEQLVDGLLSITVGMRRLEAKMDSIAESMLQRQRAPVTGDGAQGALQTSLVGREGDSSSKTDLEAHCEEKAVRSRSLLEVIDKVCIGEGPTLARYLDSEKMIKQAPVSYPSGRDAKSDASDSRFGTQLLDVAQLSEKEKPAQPAEQQSTAGLSGLEKQVTNELSVPQARAGLSFNKKHVRGTSLQPVWGGSHRGSRKEGMLTTEMLAMKPTLDVDRKLDALSESLGKKLERIAYVLGIRNLNVVDNSADDAEDRKRLMEKLKFAFESDRQKKLSKLESDGEKWLDHVFGICKPDQRIGKRGSRYTISVASNSPIVLATCCYDEPKTLTWLCVGCAGLSTQNLDFRKVSS
jgi:hypothetical protein